MLHWPSISKTLAIVLPLWLLLEYSVPGIEHRFDVTIPDPVISIFTGGFAVFVLVFFLRRSEWDESESIDSDEGG